MQRIKGACSRAVRAALVLGVLPASLSCSSQGPQATSGTAGSGASNILFTGGGASNTDTQPFQVTSPNVKFDWTLDGADQQPVIDFDVYEVDQDQRILTSHIAHELSKPPYKGQENVRLAPGKYLIHVTNSAGFWTMTVTAS